MRLDLFDTVKGTLTRSTEGFNVTGATTAEWDAANVRRIDYDPDLPGGLGLLMEGSRTQMCTTDLGGWALAGAARASATGPDGTASAYALTDDSAAATESASHPAITVAGSTTYTWSVLVKRDPSATHIASLDISEGGGGTGILRAQINPATGESVLRAASGITNGAAGSFALNDDWWLLWTRGTTSAPATQASMTVAPAQATTLNTIDAAATGTTTYAHPQMEAAWWPSSRIRTMSSTRGADVLSYAVGQYPDGLNIRHRITVVPGCSSAEVIAAAGDLVILGLRDGNRATRFGLVGGVAVFSYFTDAGARISSAALTFSRGQPITVEVDYLANTGRVTGATSGDGTFGPGTGGARITSGALYVGSAAGSAPWYGRFGQYAEAP